MARSRRRSSGPGIKGRGLVGWLFISPMVIVLGLFLFFPVVMAVWVSVSDWSGRLSPFSSGVNFIGWKNYADVLGGQGVAGRDFGLSIRNNLYYVALVVPAQTALALFLAVMVTRKKLRGTSFFRTAFYFPSVTSSVAITVLWLFLFNPTGPINQVLSWFSINGPRWFQDPRGVLHLALGSIGIQPSAGMRQPGLFGISGWDWLAGPSVAMCAFILMAVFTTSGTFMLLFIAALQNINEETLEAGMIDGANAWQRFWHITLPLLRPTLFTVITLGLIGTWQVFDQIYTGTQGGPSKTTLTPAYLSYTSAFLDTQWGRGAAIAFILFMIIIVMTILQRLILGDADPTKERHRSRRLARKKVSNG